MPKNLVEEFKADSAEYKELQTPNSTEDKRRILRSLMNIRMPKELSSEVMKVQDEYLTERAAEKGVVNLSDIPVNFLFGKGISQDFRWMLLLMPLIRRCLVVLFRCIPASITVYILSPVCN